MCSELERIMEEGELKKARTTALKLATTFGFSATQIAEAVSVDEKIITEWLAEAGINQ